ncbi:MAG: maleylpyruvate isomerase N-terminal domain-containing protein, partial [Actinomycetota bacterium]|nr:maleylpyruvate isomerase N-terminal domain-containing protein [Actinomycetota bacterium]
MNDGDSEIMGLLAEAIAIAPPNALGGAVLQSATVTRPSGQAIASLGGGQRANPAAAFEQTVDEFRSVLAAADGTEVIEPYGWSVTQLVAHLLEVALNFGRQLGLWEHEIDEAHEDDHLAMTESAVHAAVAADFAATVGRWHDVSAAVCAHVAPLDADQLQQRVKFHMLDTRLSTVLVARVFEVWTHTEDLCRTLRRDPPSLDAARLHLMTNVAVPAIPFGMLLGNIDDGPNTARIVLTGRGGGVW